MDVPTSLAKVSSCTQSLAFVDTHSKLKKKAKLRTSSDVFHRIKWDPSYEADLEEIWIGYKDRFLGIQEIKFLEFEPDLQQETGDIPFHRGAHKSYTSRDIEIYLQCFWTKSLRSVVFPQRR